MICVKSYTDIIGLNGVSLLMTVANRNVIKVGKKFGLYKVIQEIHKAADQPKNEPLLLSYIKFKWYSLSLVKT